MTTKLDTSNAYRYLFPIGCLNGILGASLWVAFRFGWVEIYPAGMHANMMIGGFLLSYAVGFLWTAIPRFFQAPAPQLSELSILIALLGASPILGLLRDPSLLYFSSLLTLLLTMRFGRRRFVLRKTDPPPSFVYVLFGLMLACGSLLVLSFQNILPFPSLLVSLARNFFLKGFVLCLVLGVGIKLIPALLGQAPLPTSTGAQTKFELHPGDGAILGALLVGVLCETLGKISLAGLFFTLALTAAAFFRMKIAAVPKTVSVLSMAVWFSTWALALSPLSLIAFPEYATHFWHLVFIAGFGHLTLFVSLRVVLAHSGQAFLQLEKRPALFFLSGFVILAAFTRVSTPFLRGDLVLDHYAYAASAWIIALLTWSYYFFKFTPFRKLRPVHAGEPAENC